MSPNPSSHPTSPLTWVAIAVVTFLIVVLSITIGVQLGQGQNTATAAQTSVVVTATPVPPDEAVAAVEPTTRPTEAPRPTPKPKPTAQPTPTPDPIKAAQAILDVDKISNPYARSLAAMYMAQGFEFVWRTAPNGTPIYQAGHRGGIVITLARPNEEPFGGVAIAVPLYARPGANDDNIALMQAMIEFFPGWEDGRVWLASSMEAWSDSLRNGTIGGLYTEARGEWQTELFYDSPELVILSVDQVTQ